MTTIPDKILIGSRKSRLALWQARQVAELLERELALTTCEMVAINSSGDLNKDKKLAEIGGKGLFVKELDEALLRGNIDIAVHSAKDVPAPLADSLTMPAVLPRADVRDVLVSHMADGIDALPEAALVGTSSPRRAAQLRGMRADLRIVDFRGNVPTRLRKLQENRVNATILAMAGLDRLAMFDDSYMHPIPTEVMLPAAGQGTICITCRNNDQDIIDILTRINDRDTMAATIAERSFLQRLGGGCYTPVAAYASVRGRREGKEQLLLQATLFATDGSEHISAGAGGDVNSAATIGEQVAEMIIAQDSEGLRYG